MIDGQKYIFYDRDNKPRDGIWIESILDIARYLSRNLFDTDGTTPLYKEERLIEFTRALDNQKRNQVEYINNVRVIHMSGNYAKDMDILEKEFNSMLIDSCEKHCNDIIVVDPHLKMAMEQVTKEFHLDLWNDDEEDEYGEDY